MSRTIKYILLGICVLCIIAFVWYFGSITIYIIISIVLAMIGLPLAKAIGKIKIMKIRIPHVIATALSLLTMLLFIIGIFGLMIPLIVNQAEALANIDFTKLRASYQTEISWLFDQLKTFDLIKKGQTIESYISEQIHSVTKAVSYMDLVQNIATYIGNIFVGLVAVLFLTFFWIKDYEKIGKGILFYIPDKFEQLLMSIVRETRTMLSRYFVGLIIETVSVMILVTLGLTIFGIENAILIGFMAGLMNIIPYLGPVIGMVIGLLIGITSELSHDNYSGLLPDILKIAGTFMISQFIDNNILQPMIYSTSVKAHPAEIFLVILIGGSLGGILGMIVAVPAYTVLKVIFKNLIRFFAERSQSVEVIQQTSDDF